MLQTYIKRSHEDSLRHLIHKRWYESQRFDVASGRHGCAGFIPMVGCDDQERLLMVTYDNILIPCWAPMVENQYKMQKTHV